MRRSAKLKCTPDDLVKFHTCTPVWSNHLAARRRASLKLQGDTPCDVYLLMFADWQSPQIATVTLTLGSMSIAEY